MMAQPFHWATLKNVSPTYDKKFTYVSKWHSQVHLCIPLPPMFYILMWVPTGLFELLVDKEKYICGKEIIFIP